MYGHMVKRSGKFGGFFGVYELSEVWEYGALRQAQ